MTQIPPTLAHEIADYDTWDPTDTATTDDLELDAEDEYPCEDCERSFDTPQGLASHSRSHK